MNVKRSVLPAAMSLCLVWAVLPAIAQANGPYWFLQSGAKVGDINNKTPFKTTGKVSYTLNKTGVTVGPCTETVGGKVWNSATNGEDETTSHTYTTPCKTSIAGCEISTAKATKLPWPSRLLYVGTAVHDRTEKVEIDFTFANNIACGKFANTTDTATGSYDSIWKPKTDCSTYDESLEELKFEGSAVKVSGEDCTTTESGEEIYAE